LYCNNIFGEIEAKEERERECKNGIIQSWKWIRRGTNVQHKKEIIENGYRLKLCEISPSVSPSLHHVSILAPLFLHSSIFYQIDQS